MHLVPRLDAVIFAQSKIVRGAARPGSAAPERGHRFSAVAQLRKPGLAAESFSYPEPSNSVHPPKNRVGSGLKAIRGTRTTGREVCSTYRVPTPDVKYVAPISQMRRQIYALTPPLRTVIPKIKSFHSTPRCRCSCGEGRRRPFSPGARGSPALIRGVFRFLFYPQLETLTSCGNALELKWRLE